MAFSTSLALLIFRIAVALAGLLIIGRLTFTAHAYRSWRAFGFFLITLGSFLAAAVYHLLSLINPPGDAATAEIFETLFAVGIVGVLWENHRADQQRHADSKKMMNQLRLASNTAQKRAQELAFLSEITRELTSSLNLRDVLQTVADRALRLGDADAVTVFVRNRETGELTDYRVTAAVTERLKNLPAPRANGLTVSVGRTGEAAFIDEVRHHPLYADGTYPDLSAIAGLPLRLEDGVVGVMNVAYTRPHQFDDNEMRLLAALADAAALAVHNASLHERITKLAVTDELTSLPNRRRFLDIVRAELQRARRYERPLTLMMVDLDHLKQINDEHGHAAGDAMLRGVAHCLRTSVRDTDLPARLGGDEFAVLLPETSREVALPIAERIRASVEKFATVLDGVTIAGTVSVGLISRNPGDTQDLPSFIHLADEALYKAKAGGRNAVIVLEPPLISSL